MKIAPEPLPPATITDQLVEEIGREIIRGDLPPGTRVTEATLVERFQVSRAPLREALGRLEERQLLVRSPYKGFTVVRLTEETIRELYEIRAGLEAIACRRAVSRITADNIAELTDILRAERVRLEAVEAGEAPPPDAIRDFHHKIVEISESHELLRLLSSEIWRHLRANNDRLPYQARRVRKAHDEHTRVLEALAERDGPLAAMLMERHVVVSGQAAIDASQKVEADRSALGPPAPQHGANA